MSGSIKIARAQAMGDPGLFGAIGGALKGAIGGLTGGPISIISGAIAGGVKGAKGGKPGGGLTPNMRGALQRLQQGKPIAPEARRALTGAGVNVVGLGPGFQANQSVPVTRTPGLKGALQRLVPGGATGFEVTTQAGPSVACPPGFHPNKTSYFLKDGTFVPEGTRCVRNRRRNPMNPRALSRAISRVESAKKASKRLSRITVRKKC